MYEEDLDDKEEEVCRSRCNEETVKESSKAEQSTEEEREKEDFNVLINERVCNDFYNVCLRNLTHEEYKILHEEAKAESKQWKEKFYAKLSMKEEEATKVTRQMEECVCRNVHNVCWNNLSREEDNII